MPRLALVLLVTMTLTAAAQDTPDPNRFAFELNRLLKPGENQLCSPVSITTVLAMAEAGARGDTAAQLRKALHLAENGHEKLGAMLRAASGKTRAANGYELAIASRIWPQRGYALEAPFLAVLTDHYAAPPVELDYKAAPEEARSKVNAWVDDATRGKIKDLLPAGSVDSLTRLILTNAIYFKGDWETAFDAKKTADGPFYAPTGEVAVPLMTLKEDLAYAGAEDVQVVELPFKGGEIGMVLFVPTAKDGLAKLEASLTSERASKLAGVLAHTSVRLHLPRFKLESAVSLVEPLRALGITDAFDVNRADFSGISGNRELYATGVFHKAFVDVTEEGAEAAAATGMTLGIKSAPPEPIAVRADRPFLFAIRDRKTGAILFLGRLVKP